MSKVFQIQLLKRRQAEFTLTARVRYKYRKMVREGKHVNVAKVACAREIACFVWGMMTDNIHGQVF
jgi:hypothetical protein